MSCDRVCVWGGLSVSLIGEIFNELLGAADMGEKHCNGMETEGGKSFKASQAGSFYANILFHCIGLRAEQRQLYF